MVCVANWQSHFRSGCVRVWWKPWNSAPGRTMQIRRCLLMESYINSKLNSSASLLLRFPWSRRLCNSGGNIATIVTSANNAPTFIQTRKFSTSRQATFSLALTLRRIFCVLCSLALFLKERREHSSFTSIKFCAPRQSKLIPPLWANFSPQRSFAHGEIYF